MLGRGGGVPSSSPSILHPFPFAPPRARSAAPGAPSSRAEPSGAERSMEGLSRGGHRCPPLPLAMGLCCCLLLPPAAGSWSVQPRRYRRRGEGGTGRAASTGADGEMGTPGLGQRVTGNGVLWGARMGSTVCWGSLGAGHWGIGTEGQRALGAGGTGSNGDWGSGTGGASTEGERGGGVLWGSECQTRGCSTRGLWVSGGMGIAWDRMLDTGGCQQWGDAGTLGTPGRGCLVQNGALGLPGMERMWGAGGSPGLAGLSEAGIAAGVSSHLGAKVP